jgi:phosphate uptake regulator
MSDAQKQQDWVLRELKELERRLIAIGNMVEDLFAESVMGIVDHRPPPTNRMRKEDCQAHEHCLAVEKLGADLLARGALAPAQSNYVLSATRIANDLRNAADMSLHAACDERRGHIEDLPPEVPLEDLPQMATIVQGMLSDCIGAFINHDPDYGNGLHSVFRQVVECGDAVTTELGDGIANGRITPASGLAMAHVCFCIERIAHQALDISNTVSHMNQSIRNA